MLLRMTQPFRTIWNTGARWNPRRKAWAVFLLLASVFLAAEFYVVYAARISGGQNSQIPLAETGITLIQSTLRSSMENPAFPLVALGVAFILGGLHALAPGHNKLLTGAFLVGSGGRVSHAVLIGASTAFSHTASVLVIGALAMTGPGQEAALVFMRWLGLPSGMFVAGLGAYLLLRNLRLLAHSRRRSPVEVVGVHREPDGRSGRSPVHNPDHKHDHIHGHDHHHQHHLTPDRISLGGLVTLGLLHGVVPTADALAVLLVALSVGRALLGLGLILAYSLGIAVVMSLVGVLFISSRGALEQTTRFDGLVQWLPAAASALVIFFGLLIFFRSLGLFVL